LQLTGKFRSSRISTQTCC